MKPVNLVYFLFVCVILGGIALLGYLLVHLDFAAPLSITAFKQTLLAAPILWGYALASAGVLLVLLSRLPTQLPAWRFRYRFRHVDSAALDSDSGLCRTFYREALAFRLDYGNNKFTRAIIPHFEFFYDFHNEALRWLNQIVDAAGEDTVPVNFIVATIRSGQIGKVYSGARYGGGLASVTLSINEPIYLHARMDGVEIWSASSSTPVCRLNLQPLKLQQGQRQPDYLSCYISGLEKISHKPRRLELRCLTCTLDAQAGTEQYAREQLQTLRNWISDLAITIKHSNQHNFGIHVDEIETQDTYTAAQAAQTPLALQLQRLLGQQIDSFFTRAGLPVSDPNLALDAVVLCSGFGIVAVSEIKLGGTVTYSGDPGWAQVEGKSSTQVENACLRAQRAKSALANLLSTHGLIQWPVHSVVVFSQPDVTLNLVMGKQRVQCDVIKLAQLEKWFAKNSLDDTIRFTKDDYNKFIAVLDPARQPVKHEMRA